MFNYTFDRLVDLGEIRQLLESHHSFTGMAYSIFGADDKNLVAVGWQDICVRFYLVNPFICARYHEGDAFIGAHLVGSEKDFAMYSCKNGMIDAGMPVVIEGKHMATFYMGQFFCDADRPDTDFFLSQAEALGFDGDEYLRALERVPVLSREEIRGNLLFLCNTIHALAKSGLEKLRLVREVEERKQTEQQLRDTQSRLAAVLKTIPDLVWLKNTEGVYLACNPAFEKMLGSSETEIAGKTDYDFVDAGLADYFIQRDREAVAAGRLCIYEEEAAWAADGLPRLLENRKMPLFGQDGQMLGVLGIARDITGQKRMEKELHNREQEFRALVENAPDLITRYDRDCSLIYANPAVERIFGNQAAALTGLKGKDVLPGSSAIVGKMDRYVRQVVSSGRPVEAEVEIAGKDGQLRYFLNNYAPEREKDGEIKSVLVISRDITERKRMEEVQRESEKTLQSLMENMPAGCIWTDIDGNIEYINKYFVELFGYTREEIPTLQVLFERISPDPVQRQRIEAAYTLAFSKTKRARKPFQPMDTRITRKDGSSRHVIVNAHPVRARLLAVLTDVTEREHLQDELLKIQKLESLGVLAGGIAHDFSNILTGVIGHISLAQRSLSISSGAHVSLEIARKAALRATDLTRRLLTFAKGDVPIKGNVAIRNLINESISLALQGSCVQGNVLIPDGLHEIEADEGQISQVFNNIVINAVQSMPGGGTLTVQAGDAGPDECRTIGLPAGAYLRVSFTDEGCGISEEDQKRIFDPYFTTKSTGNGLGLASCHSIVAKHSGRIHVSSKLGTGTTFTIYLPSMGMASRQSNRDKPGKKVEPRKPTSGAVLVMDEKETILRFVGRILERIGYRATVCADGEAAVTLYKEAKEAGRPFDAVIMDLAVPNGMGGEEAARHILRYDPTARLVVSSGYSENPILDRYARYGFSGFLAKPYTIGQLTQVLDTLCHKNPQTETIN